MKGYHSDRVTQSIDLVASRRNLIRAALIGELALVLAAASAGARPDPALKEATPVIGDSPLDGQFGADGHAIHTSGTGSADA